MVTAFMDEANRVERLLDAQSKAVTLFDEATSRDLVRPGLSEAVVSDSLRDLANELFGVRRYWHKRLVRSGPNTVAPYKDNPPDRIIGEDDILILDFGPIFEGWEADLGRTIVFGDDPVKRQMELDVARIWNLGHEYFSSEPDITAADLYAFVLAEINGAGYGHGLGFVGHLVGEFPHEALNFPDDGASAEEIACYIAPGNDQPLRRLDRDGRSCHWILEVFLVDEANGYGAFKEQLLDI